MRTEINGQLHATVTEHATFRDVCLKSSPSTGAARTIHAVLALILTQVWN